MKKFSYFKGLINVGYQQLSQTLGFIPQQCMDEENRTKNEFLKITTKGTS